MLTQLITFSGWHSAGEFSGKSGRCDDLKSYCTYLAQGHYVSQTILVSERLLFEAKVLGLQCSTGCGQLVEWGKGGSWETREGDVRSGCNDRCIESKRH